MRMRHHMIDYVKDTVRGAIGKQSNALAVRKDLVAVNASKVPEVKEIRSRMSYGTAQNCTVRRNTSASTRVMFMVASCQYERGAG